MSGPSPSELLKARLEEEQAYAAGDWDGLSRALLAQAGQVKTEPERAGLVCRAGLATLRAEHPDQAVEVLAQVGTQEPWGALSRLLRLEIHWRHGHWKEIAALIDEELAAAGPWDQTALRLEKARVLALRLGMVEEGRAEIETVLQQKPDSREALWLKLVLALRAGDWQQVAGIYARIHELATADQDGDLLESLSLRLGQLEEFRFRRAPEAKAWYEKISVEKTPLLGRIALFELAQGQGDWQSAAAQLEAMIDATADEAPPRSFRLLLSRIKEDLLNDREGALTQLNTLLEKAPDDFDGLYSATQLTMEGGSAEARVALEEKLIAQLQDPKEISFFAADRTRLLVEDLAQYEPAVEAARKVLEVIPEDGSAPRWMIEALRRAGRYEEAVQEIDKLLAGSKDPRVRQGLLFTKAELATHMLNDQKTALVAYQEAMQIPPSHMPVLNSMARIYHLNNDHENLARFLVAILKMIQDPGPKKYYQNWLATIYLERLNREDQAFALFGELVKSDPTDRGALKTIVRISKSKAAWNNVAGAVSRIIDDCKDQNLANYNRALLAWLYEIRLNQKDKAKALYGELAQAANGFAREGVCRINLAAFDLPAYIGSLAPHLESMEAGKLRAARLVRLAMAREIQGELTEAWADYEKARVTLAGEPHLFLPMIDQAQLAGYWGRYTALVEEFAGRLAEPSRRALLWETAWSRSELPGANGELDAAAMFQAFGNLAQADSSVEAHRGMILASLWTGDNRGRADVLARLLTQVAEPSIAPLRLRLGYTLRDELGAKEESVAALRQVLAKDQKSSPLLRELAMMYTEAGQWGEVIRMMLLEIPLRKEPDVLIHMYDHLARLYEEKFKAVDEAIKCHSTILKMAPARVESHEARVRLYEGKGSFEEMVTSLAAYEAAMADPAVKITILVRSAQVLDEKLKDPDRAIASLKKALDLDPTRTDLLAALEKIYEREQRFPELVEILIAQAERVPDVKVKAVLHERVASLQEEKLSNVEAAVEHLVIARDFDPERTSVLLTLERLYTSLERWPELIDTLERLAALSDDQAKIGYYSRIGALWDEKLQKLPEAIASWERVRPLDPQNVPAHDALVSLYERSQDWPNFVERSVALAELVTDDKPKSVGLLVKAGSILETQLQNEDRALQLYHRGMEIDDHAIPPVIAARAIYERREAWPDVVAMWLKEEAIVEEVPRKLEIFTTVGNIHEQKTQDVPSAIQAYESALTLKADHLPSVEPLSEIFWTQQNHAKGRPLFEIRTRTFTDQTPQVQTEVWYKCGFMAEQLEDVPAAMERYLHSVEAVAEYRPPLERLSELYAAQEKWDEASTFTNRLLVVVRRDQDLEFAFVLLRRLGHVEDKRNQLPAAVLAYEQALEIKPGHYETLNLLIDLYLRTKEWKKSLTAYDQLIKNAPSKEAAAVGLVGKGKVLEDHLNEEKSALAHFQAAVKYHPAQLEGWRRISAIQLRNKVWPEAEIALKNCIQLDKDGGRLVEHHYNLGRVYVDGMSDLDRGQAEFEAALSIDPVHIPSMQSLLDVYLQQEQWQKFLDTGEKFVRLVPEDAQESLIPTYIEMGRVYRDHTDNKERAVIHFQTAIKMNPENQDARAELAALYLSDPKFIDMAKTENRKLIHMEPWRAQTYRDLMSIFKSQKNLDGMFFISHVLSILDTLDYEEEMFYEQNKSKVRTSTKKTLAETERDGQLLHPDERGALHDMLVAMSDNLTKTFPITAERLGAKKHQRLDGKSEHPIKDLATEIAIALGLDDLDIYITPAAELPTVIPTAPNTLMINNEWFNKFSDLEKRFIMARLIEHAVDRHGLVLHFPPEKVMQTLCLIAMGVDGKVNVTPPGGLPADAEKQKKVLSKLVSRKVKTQVEHAAERFTQDSLVDPNQWKLAMEHSANRTGLLFCGNLFVAFDAIIKTNPQYARVRYEGMDLKAKMEIWGKDPYIIELLDFAVSDQFYRVRARMGLSIT